MFGFINVYKPKGITSFDVISVLRKLTKIRQIGHTGTLDPFAQGVLPVCIGNCTRLIEYVKEDKSYLATCQFGKTTDTYDIEGKITFIYDKKITKDDIINALKNFKGEITQTPPMYSAIKVNGQKLCDVARAGKTVEIPERKVYIKNIELREFDEENQIGKIYVECSKGTYIRSIANDLGKAIGSGAFLTDLIRLSSGRFNVENSVKLEMLTDKSSVEENIINPLDVIDLKKFEIDEENYKRVTHGQIINNFTKINNDLIILTYNNRISAVAHAKDKEIKVKKVFV